MSSPFDAGRDSNADSSNDFGDDPDISDDHFDAFQASFQPRTNNLAEQDYRQPEHGGSGFESVTPVHEPMESPQRFTYPERPAGGRLAD
jgi:hypothetical protein